MVLNGMQNNKIPGIDGLPTEYYNILARYISFLIQILKALLLYHSAEKFLPLCQTKLKVLGKS